MIWGLYRILVGLVDFTEVVVTAAHVLVSHHPSCISSVADLGPLHRHIVQYLHSAVAIPPGFYGTEDHNQRFLHWRLRESDSSNVPFATILIRRMRALNNRLDLRKPSRGHLMQVLLMSSPVCFVQ